MPTAVAKSLSKRQLAGIHTLWKLIDAGRGDERDSRTARLEYCSAILRRPVASAKDLSSDEAEKVLQAMRQEVGQEWKPRGNWRRGRRPPLDPLLTKEGKPEGGVVARLAEMSADLWGGCWQEMLGARLLERFRVRSPRSLRPAQARWFAEELLQRLAVRNIADRHQSPIGRKEIEEEKAKLRGKYFPAAVAAIAACSDYRDGAQRAPLQSAEA